MGRRSDGRRTRANAWCRLLAPIFVAALAVCSAAFGTARAAEACGPASGDTPARIAAISDTFDIRLDDGRTLRLAGLDLPIAPERAAAARQALEDWAKRGPLTVRPLAAVPDRWGRVPALLDRSGTENNSAATLLIEQGLARARPEPGIHPCFADFLAAEDRARDAKRGIWTDPGTATLRADDVDALARASGGFAVIDGTLQVHASRSGTLYLTLGRDRWGFAAVLTRRDAARFAKEGLDVSDYVGSPVRLRGDLDDRFGARMRLSDPDQIQSLEPGALDPGPAPRR